MVLIPKWLLEHDPEARILIITDRDELDKQIEGVMKSAGVITKLIRIRRDKILSNDKSAGISNFSLSSAFHCGPSSFGQTIRIFERRERAISSLTIKPALIVLPRPTSSARSVTGKRRQKVMRFVN